MKRFYTEAGVAGREDGWALVLDGKPVKTPARADCLLPTEAAARLLAQEWSEQADRVDLLAMPATRLAFSVIDLADSKRNEWAERIAAYGASDLLCFWTDEPHELLERQQTAWRPWLDWAARALGAELQAAAGALELRQTPEALRAMAAAVLELDDWRRAGGAELVGPLGSAVLTLAVLRGELSAETAFDLSRLEETFQNEKWGQDAEAAAAAARTRRDLVSLGRFLHALRPTESNND